MNRRILILPKDITEISFDIDELEALQDLAFKSRNKLELELPCYARLDEFDDYRRKSNASRCYYLISYCLNYLRGDIRELSDHDTFCHSLIFERCRDLYPIEFDILKQRLREFSAVNSGYEDDRITLFKELPGQCEEERDFPFHIVYRPGFVDKHVKDGQIRGHIPRALAIIKVPWLKCCKHVHEGEIRLDELFDNTESIDLKTGAHACAAIDPEFKKVSFTEYSDGDGSNFRYESTDERELKWIRSQPCLRRTFTPTGAFKIQGVRLDDKKNFPLIILGEECAEMRSLLYYAHKNFIYRKHTVSINNVFKHYAYWMYETKRWQVVRNPIPLKYLALDKYTLQSGGRNSQQEVRT